jgi:hypothetical protein
MNMFNKDLQSAESRMRREVSKDKLIRCFTLGFWNNSQSVTTAGEQLDGARCLAERYNALRGKAKDLDDELLSYVELDGVRVSKNTFADFPRLGAQGYPIDWEELRVLVLTRDNFRCREASIHCVDPLQIHHVVPLTKGGTNKMDNLITLCLFHHSQKHEHMRARYNGNLWR